ncbi:MAG: hypothetical protein C5S38_04730 [Candidatus Methanophagaceae archaeon]|nr:MAG: hypothetical protein C5S38_04730 [Methanophagales archaeon]
MELSLLIQKMNTLKLVFVAAIAISVGVLILPNAVWVMQEAEKEENISSYNDFISAGGFGRDATEFDVGGMAGHQSLIREAERNSQMTGANEACFACHTGINVSVSIPKSKSMSFNAGTKDDGDFSARGGRRESEGKLFEIG